MKRASDGVEADNFQIVATEMKNDDSRIGLTATTASPMASYGRGHSFFPKMAMVAEF